MAEEHISQEFRLKNRCKTRNDFLKEIKQNELMSKIQKNFCTSLNYIDLFVILNSTINTCISISVFTSLIGIPLGITSSAIE